jgi:hypothetical protein
MRGAAVGVLLALALPASAGALVFKPSPLPAGKVGVPYRVVLRVSIGGHSPALGKNVVQYTVNCYGADHDGNFIDSCSKMPPGIAVKAYGGGGICAPPLTKPSCALLSGTPKKAGTYVFQIFVPDVNSISVRGIPTTFRLVVRP